MNFDSMFPSKYLKASDYDQPKVHVIKGVYSEPVGQDKEMKPIIYFEGEERGMVLNVTNGRMIAHLYGNETDNWKGEEVEVYKELVSFQGKPMDGIRVRQPTAPATPAFEDEDVGF